VPSARGTSVVSSIVVLPVVGYALSRWHRLTTWGATDVEAGARMPGDEIVGRARYRSTHAVTINAPAAGVWPWLVQMGQGRGGLYSYDALENLLGLKIHSAQEIDADLQALTVGDVVRLVPEGTEPPLRFTVARLDAPSLLVLGPEGTRSEAFAAHLPFPCWTFQLTSVGATACRLVVRFQADFDPTPLNFLAYKYALQPVHFVMERKMMLGIKQRAERASRPARHPSAMSA
jgi:hypothetical protein